MLRFLLGNILGGEARAGRREAAAFRRACALYASAEHEAARALCDEALRASPGSARIHYLRGLAACALGDTQDGAATLERGLNLGRGDPLHVAALADARLLEQREDEANALYCRAFPELAHAIERVGEPASPWKQAHPDWTQGLRKLTLPRPPVSASPESWKPGSLADTRATHLLNWGLLLVRRRRVRAGIRLIGEALRADESLGYGHAVLALLHTLDHAWAEALAAGIAARGLGAEAIRGATDLCIVSAQIGLGTPAHELDPLFDWRPLRGVDDDSHLDLLPPLQGLPPAFAPDALIYFVGCDTGYLAQHAVALVHSIRAHCGNAAIHLHLFEPAAEAWATVEALCATAPRRLSITWEEVPFDDYSGKALYCACARFVRLYQVMLGTSNRVVMLDADSLVRGDLAHALAGAGDIGLVRARHEPPWHNYLAGFCAFRRSEASVRFLRELSAFLAANLSSGRARRYLDQLALYVCARRAEAQGVGIEDLSIGTFCDTLFTEEALVWSVTQNKDADSRFTQYTREVLARYAAPSAP